MIAAEVLAGSMVAGAPDRLDGDWFAYTDTGLGVAYWLRRR